ncbi:hypothetical protein P4C99_09230 [Pontiellaceae bacterium B1224]|nr:hypothetical protein [Pontiellaceae bacterium B1224]
MFKMRPNMGALTGALVVFLLGALIFYEGHRDPGNIPAQDRSKLIFTISIVISGILLIVSTGRMWFKHLWHDRYAGKKRKHRKTRS